MPGYRKNRVAEDVKREIIAIIRELKDPRIQGLLTVVRVDVSQDSTSAKVYISALEGIETAKLSVKGLESATGRIRREVGQRLHLRLAPELKFIADDSVERGTGITKILNDLKDEKI
jgi:ribosome-binding factor A